MSRAFTKEDDAGDDLPERPVPPGPNYVTPKGLEMLREAGREIVAKKKAAEEGADLRPYDRDLRYLEARIDTAIVVPPGSGTEIRFGARVTLEDHAGQRRAYQIVGEDQARTSEDYLAWSSPLASALFGAKPGDAVTLEGEPAATYRVLEVDFPSS